VICKQYKGFLLGNKDPLNMPVSRRPVKESLVYGATQTNREGERLALAEKVTQFYAKKYPLRSDHARGQFQ